MAPVTGPKTRSPPGDEERWHREERLLARSAQAEQTRCERCHPIWNEAPGGVEVQRPSIRVLAAPAERPPIELRRPELKEQLPTILDHAPVALRHPGRRAVFELGAATLAGFRAALDRLDFTEVQTPKIVASATESGANLFGVDYFGRPAFLAQSPHFYKQIMVGVFERVYEVGPVFRAEPHDTARHLAEYVSLDAEVGFIEDHHTVMRFARQAVAGMAQAVAALGAEAPEVPEEIPWLHFATPASTTSTSRRRTSAASASGHGASTAPTSCSSSASRWRSGRSTRIPTRSGRSTRRASSSSSAAELVTGGQRLHRYEDYVAALAARGESPEPYEGYLQAFPYGMPPHGGFAIGLERWLARLVGARTSARRRSSRATSTDSCRRRRLRRLLSGSPALPASRLRPFTERLALPDEHAISGADTGDDQAVALVARPEILRYDPAPMHLRAPSFDHGTIAGAWAIGLGLYLFLGMLAIGIGLGTAVIVSIVAIGLIFLYVRLYGEEELRQPRGG